MRVDRFAFGTFRPLGIAKMMGENPWTFKGPKSGVAQKLTLAKPDRGLWSPGGGPAFF